MRLFSTNLCILLSSFVETKVQTVPGTVGFGDLLQKRALSRL